MTTPMKIETARTLIRGWCEADIPAYAQIVADPEVMKFIWNGSTQNASEAADFVQNFIRIEQERGWIPWAVEEKATGVLMGWCGFGRRDGQVDFGYRFARSFWGMGLGSEVAQAVLAYGISHFHFTKCTAAVHIENTASVRILEKLGFRFVRKIEQQGIQIAHYLYQSS